MGSLAALALCSDDRSGELHAEMTQNKSQLQLTRPETELNSRPNGSSHQSEHPPYLEPICRRFWKAGNYEAGQTQRHNHPNQSSDKSHLRVHPMFLHSNATSHKWVFGAIAELLDNAIDEIQNGATFVVIDKILNPRDGRPALLIQDDGEGMDAEAVRCCMSFGFSNKTKSSIGQYGNGFKTSTMRLGADAVVLSRHKKMDTLTQSAGLLSYTFLRQMGHDKIVVPMVNYAFNTSTGASGSFVPQDQIHFYSNLHVLLQWSPFATEEELLQQFDDIGQHGTKVIIYNLWLNNDGEMELDFDSDPEDIKISGAVFVEPGQHPKPIFDLHVANAYKHSLRAYLSILYLKLPGYFLVKLRGRAVEQHNVASDLKYPEVIVYRPHNEEIAVITTIGFLKEAPDVNIHGFNIYHRKRLILPFWPVLKASDGKGRGVVGVLDVNDIEPTHNKQDFEKTSLFQKLEDRLKQMTAEYWNLHCELIGYRKKKFLSNTHYDDASGPQKKLKRQRNPPAELEFAEARIASTSHLTEQQHCNRSDTSIPNEETTNLLHQNERLRLQLLESKGRVEYFTGKLWGLQTDLKAKQYEYLELLAESEAMDLMYDSGIV